MTGERPIRRRPGEVSLERALSKLGAASRAEARERIRAGRVTVDGRVCHDPGRPVVPERAMLAVDGEPVAAAAWRTLALHKPAGVMTTRRDPRGRPTVFDLLGTAAAGLVAVGRLDLETSGLLLLTTDTRLADWLADPENAVPRRYRARVAGAVDDAALDRLVSGVVDRGERLRAASAERLGVEGGETELALALTTGRNREVRRLCAAVGHPVVALARLAYGGVELGDLAPGAWRALSRTEVSSAFGALAPVGRGPVRRALSRR
jgi:23S rRNA pseudouridine2605 synthase